MKKRIRILSIDGGGIRGIIPATILTELEQRLQAKTSPDKRLADFFDFMAGTSTGGILVCGYLCPDSNGRPKLAASEMRDLYMKRGGDIFDVSLRQHIRTLGGLLDERYENTALRAALSDTLGNIALNDLLLPCLIPAYDIERRAAYFFNSVDGSKQGGNFAVTDLARATAAAPTYFETAQITSLDKVRTLALIDGGVFANNPAMCAYAEARSLNFKRLTGNPNKGNKPSGANMLMLSVGTGSLEKPYPFEQAKNWGLAQWAQPIIDILQGGNSETVSFQLEQLFDASRSQDFYHRFEPALGKASPELDDASPKNLQALQAAGNQFVAEQSERLDNIVQQLLDHD